MAWLELKIDTLPSGIEAAAAALTAAGFEDLVLEDQAEFETFLEGNKAYWDYIDEDLQQKLQGLSCIKLYLEDTDEAGMDRLQALLAVSHKAQKMNTIVMEIPVCYGGDYGPDLGYVAEYNHLTPEEVVRIHASAE